MLLNKYDQEPLSLNRTKKQRLPIRNTGRTQYRSTIGYQYISYKKYPKVPEENSELRITFQTTESHKTTNWQTATHLTRVLSDSGRDYSHIPN